MIMNIEIVFFLVNKVNVRYYNFQATWVSIVFVCSKYLCLLLNFWSEVLKH